MRPTAGVGTNLIDPRVLARIDNLELLARTVVDGFLNGLHRSPYLGLSLDFAEHRPYMPGDDIRRIDWRLYARTDRFHIKQFEADTNSDFVAVVDVSGSMRFGSGGIPKIDYARYLAATLLYFSSRQRDRVGMVAFDDEIVEQVPASAKHLDIALHALTRLKPGRPGSLAGPLSKVAESLRRRSIIALISDFYAEPESVVEAVRALRYRGNDVIVFHLLDPAELELPYDGSANFEDLESGELLPVVTDAIRARYRELVAGHTAALSKLFTDERIDYALFDTGQPLDHALFHYLSHREQAKQRVSPPARGG